MKLQMLRPVAIAAILILTARLSLAAVVYDNTTTSSGNQYYATNAQFGDEITLAGTDRELTQFSFYAYAPSAGLTYILRLYQNDGINGAPSSLLYDGSIDAPQSLVAGYQTYTVTFPSLVVPNTLTWTVQFSSPDAGLLLYDPPTVGSSFNDFWQFNSGAWALMQVGGAPGNFAAQLTAVPEPGVLALGVLGGLVLVALKRSRRA